MTILSELHSPTQCKTNSLTIKTLVPMIYKILHRSIQTLNKLHLESYTTMHKLYTDLINIIPVGYNSTQTLHQLYPQLHISVQTLYKFYSQSYKTRQLPKLYTMNLWTISTKIYTNIYNFFTLYTTLYNPINSIIGEMHNLREKTLCNHTKIV